MSLKKIIVDAANEEEIRVATVVNDELEDYDFEVSNKEEVKGNIYLAKVTRVESSLQAVFVEYGRNRQGFLPFNEINIDYFNLSKDTKEKLKQEYQEFRLKKKRNKDNQAYNKTAINNDFTIDKADSVSNNPTPYKTLPEKQAVNTISKEITKEKTTTDSSTGNPSDTNYLEDNISNLISTTSNDYFMNLTKSAIAKPKKEESLLTTEDNDKTKDSPNQEPVNNENIKLEDKAVNSSTGLSETTNEHEEVIDTKEDKLAKEYLDYGTRFGYKIQEVINKNQLILVQVVKDERGNKGASLTTYLSIPGRYCVFMPNSYNFEGGISKKIVDPKERNRLKDILNGLNVPEESTLIIRTAGVGKSKEDIEQDYSYILNLWTNIKAQIENSSEPALIYEEASLIKKTLRDSQFDEVHINNKNTFYNMVEFTKLMSPETTKKIKLFQGKRETIFSYFNIEEQVKSIYSPIVFLKSGGYLVIHPTEALTAIDINSGKFKGNKNVEETALKNNLEAAKEIAKQIKLRNLGGLIVIDFIDMENPKNRALVEKKLKDEVKGDKAKIQVGQISSFGLLEMARQHVKSSLFEKNFIICPKCQGMGYLKPLELNAIQILRDIKSDIANMSAAEEKHFKIKLPSNEAFYILNNKRHTLNNLEECFDTTIIIECDDSLSYPFYEIKEISNDNTKDTNQTVLLLETEIANNIKSLNSKNNYDKPRNNNNNHKHRHKNLKHKENNNRRNPNANHNNKNNKIRIETPKKSWLKRLLNI